MYTAIVFLALVALGAAVSVQDVVLDEWQEFKLTFDKTYADFAEEQLRYNIFKENKVHIAKHNMRYALGEESYQLGLNHLSDMLSDEILESMTGLELTFVDETSNEVKDEFLLADVELPDSLDWRSRGAVLPVKNQGRCGSCWAFAAIGALESRHFLKTRQLVELSEQNLVDCSRQNHGCHGGWPSVALTFIQQNHGIDTARSYPYRGVDQQCHFNRGAVGATVNSVVNLPQGNEQKLLEAVAQGPVAVAIDASGNFGSYRSGVYDVPHCSRTNLNHAVLIVGYGNEGGRPYWLVRNSWSGVWGEGGYIKMARNKNMCGIAQFGTYPIV